MKSFRHYVSERVVEVEVNEGDRHQRNVDYVNSHREALGYRKIGRSTHPDKVREHLARIDKHAPYGNDPWEKIGNDYGRRSSSRNENEDVEENRLERGGPRGYVEREGAKVRDAQDKMLAQSEAEEKKPPFGKGKDDGDDDEEGDEKKPPFGKKKGKESDDDDDEDDSKDKKKGDKKPPFGKGKDEKKDDDKDDKKEESLAEHYLRLMGYPQG